MPQTPLDVLTPYFFSGTAEGELRILKDVFIQPAQMAEVLHVPMGNPRILVGTKGMGKSAILHRLHQASQSQRLPALLLTPSDLAIPPLNGQSDLATLERALLRCLVRALAVHVGAKLGGMLSSAAKSLRDEALKDGLVDEDLVERGVTLLAAVAKPIAGVDFAQLSKDLGGGTSDAALFNSVREYLHGHSSVMFLLFDDTDQVASPDEPKEINRIWGMLHALRDVAARIPELKVVATLRSEVWTRLKSAEGHRETIDHFRACMLQLRGSEELLERIAHRRIVKAAESLAKGKGLGNDAWSLFFEGNEVQIPGAGARQVRTWKSFLVTNSRERARDLVLLVSALVKEARKRVAETTAGTIPQAGIVGADLFVTLPRFSKERLEDLSIEVGKVCPQFRSVAESFATLAFELRYDDLRQHLGKLPSRFPIQMRGKTLRPQERDTIDQLHTLLHEYGFINARVDDARQLRGFRYLTFDDRPELTDAANINEAKAARWDVHPVFRSHLQQLRSPANRS
ncbi:hypothetical protein HUA76_36885 [Myxococcus sp. CA056]|uniref:P-loop ATPase, Sll1717 family n=1 Tax=Myxococcus sp. CA056 TaxID=2741740 RepID=UPI00157A6BAD|nr:hypothetical protein [Myxococcus sp. CA056]NTX16361.1 hypothetical protein [Myxococcus sp. CA056]